MMYWIHINFWFNKPFLHLHQISFLQFLRIIDGRLKDATLRRFFLYEPNPHCFFALELKDKSFIPFIKRELHYIKEGYLKKFYFVDRFTLKLNTSDYDNTEGFLNILDAATTRILLDNKICSLTHIIHCLVNNAGFSKKEERELYILMSKLYREG